MSLFKGKYLRVLTPRTVDGNIHLLVDDKVQYKETHLPFSALKSLEKENAKRASHLKHKIEVVDDSASAEPENEATSAKTRKK